MLAGVGLNSANAEPFVSFGGYWQNTLWRGEGHTKGHHSHPQQVTPGRDEPGVIFVDSA